MDTTWTHSKTRFYKKLGVENTKFDMKYINCLSKKQLPISYNKLLLLAHIVCFVIPKDSKKLFALSLVIPGMWFNPYLSLPPTVRPKSFDPTYVVI